MAFAFKFFKKRVQQLGCQYHHEGFAFFLVSLFSSFGSGINLYRFLSSYSAPAKSHFSSVEGNNLTCNFKMKQVLLLYKTGDCCINVKIPTSYHCLKIMMKFSLQFITLTLLNPKTSPCITINCVRKVLSLDLE